MPVDFLKTLVFTTVFIIFTVPLSAQTPHPNDTPLPSGINETLQVMTGTIAEQENWCDDHPAPPSPHATRSAAPSNASSHNEEMEIYWTRDENGDCTIPAMRPVSTP